MDLRPPVPTPGEAALDRADLLDRIETAARGERRRLLAAAGVTAVLPVNFLVQALIFWREGWPEAAPLVFGVMVLISVVLWTGWLRERRESRQLLAELAKLDATPPSQELPDAT